MNLPPLPVHSLLVECGQSFVEGWTRSQVQEYALACVKVFVEQVLADLEKPHKVGPA